LSVRDFCSGLHSEETFQNAGLPRRPFSKPSYDWTARRPSGDRIFLRQKRGRRIVPAPLEVFFFEFG
jgi:hypothetical protein